MILEKLDEIHWSQLRHAYGSAEDVPDLVRALLSEDREARWSAISELFNRICHQGTIYEASSYTVPFLQELLSLPETKDKPLIADLLATLADGYASLELAAHDENWERIYREMLTKEGRDFDQEFVDGRRYVQATREAIGRWLSVLYPYLACEEPEVRGTIATALKYYPEHSAVTLPLIEEALHRETSEDVRLAMQNVILVLSGGKDA